MNYNFYLKAKKNMYNSIIIVLTETGMIHNLDSCNIFIPCTYIFMICTFKKKKRNKNDGVIIL